MNVRHDPGATARGGGAVVAMTARDGTQIAASFAAATAWLKNAFK